MHGQQNISAADQAGPERPSGRAGWPGPFDEHFAATLRLSKQDLLTATGTGDTIAQTGAAYLPDPFPVPLMSELAIGVTEPIIETFVVDPDSGSCTPTGDDRVRIEAWLPIATTMVQQVTGALSANRVAIDGPAYLTASLTPVDQVTTVPHFDDDQYFDGHGVGVVAIAASHDGPRLARGALAAPRAMANGPLGLDQSDLDQWFEPDEEAPGASHRVQGTGADRVVLFPRFGQLHAGPPLAANSAAGASDGGGVRNLLVLRADTVPSP